MKNKSTRNTDLFHKFHLYLKDLNPSSSYIPNFPIDWKSKLWKTIRKGINHTKVLQWAGRELSKCEHIFFKLGYW